MCAETGWSPQKPWLTNGTGPIHPAGCVTGAAMAMGPGLLGAHFWLPSVPLGTHGRGMRTKL